MLDTGNGLTLGKLLYFRTRNLYSEAVWFANTNFKHDQAQGHDRQQICGLCIENAPERGCSNQNVARYSCVFVPLYTVQFHGLIHSVVLAIIFFIIY